MRNVYITPLHFTLKKQGNNSDFVKIIYKKNGNFDLALRKRRFCNAKEPLLPCKTCTFQIEVQQTATFFMVSNL